MLTMSNYNSLDLLLSRAFSAFGIDKDQWRYVSGSTFGSTWSSVLTVTAIYLSTIFSIKFALKDRKPFTLKKFSAVHNLFLSLISAVLLLLFAEQLIPPLTQNGLFWSVCDNNNWTQKLELLYYFNYLIKWYEFVDTILLVLKKKPTPFLHVYHHSVTMILCFTQLEGSTTVSWVPVTINLFVHSFGKNLSPLSKSPNSSSTLASSTFAPTISLLAATKSTSPTSAPAAVPNLPPSSDALSSPPTYSSLSNSFSILIPKNKNPLNPLPLFL
ncbi:hypothetical protein BB560_007178, partial [Smittium megazygosporum]